jgi:hypothetical protein
MLRSTKPFIATTRDAIIVAFATVIILIVIMGFYYYFTDPGYLYKGEFWMGILKTAMTTFIIGYVYEYGGLNAKFSSDSMRYALGTALDKYQSRNSAHIAEIAAEIELEMARKNSINEEVIRNADTLRAMARATRELKVITRMDGETPTAIHEALTKRYKTKLSLRDIELLTNIYPGDKQNLRRLRAVPRLMELIGANRDLLVYFIEHGMAHLVVGDSPNAVLDIPKLSAATGIKIHTIGGSVPN